MATLLLSAAGAAIGAGFGGTVMGLSGTVIGRAVGATLGNAIDQRVMGAGSDPVAVGRTDRLRMMGAGQGQVIARAWGRVRLGGHVIWASPFAEHVARSGGGKGSPRPRTDTYSYTITLAVGLCEGVISRVGRVWADGNEIDVGTLAMRIYRGTEDQEPDARIEAIEGSGLAPAYRGLAYVVIEDLDLARFGNRVPQFSFEVIRPAQGDMAARYPDLSRTIPGVCMIPGTGEYALATTPVHFSFGPGDTRSINVNTPGQATDFAASLRQLAEELPEANAVSLVVSWFGSDLRCGHCTIRPKVEQRDHDGVGMPWGVSGLPRAQAEEVPRVDGRSIYGGTTTDAAVIEAIQALREAGKDVTFYPFVLMDQIAGNVLVNPWTGEAGQPVLPWRGRITLERAAGVEGSSHGTAAAANEVVDFFGAAQPGHFDVQGGHVTYSGPSDWGYRRFILHYARLCALAGGVEAFCIGSEMRSMTTIRGAGNSYPVVVALRQLAADVRGILGPDTKISYAADWSEYFGHHNGNDLRFHLDPLWADPNIDFIGIDNYMPLADWRDGETHADAHWGSIHDIGYLKSNIAGGEGFDWYYSNPSGAAAQLRLPITDEAESEPWVYRYKDLVSWWSNLHHDRVDGVRQSVSTAWQPRSKPIRFTEFGCAAIDKGANEPNRFLDPKSSESGLPKYSSGRRDDLMQLAYFAAMHRHWTDPANNPVSSLYNGPMLDFAHSMAWAWDARPFPAFPAHEALWGDAVNYEAGHWLSGRAASQPLAAVIAEICGRAGIDDPDVARADGVVRGYAISGSETARATLQPVLLAHSVESVESDGLLHFRTRGRTHVQSVDPMQLARHAEIDDVIERTRADDGETVDRIRLSYVEAEGDFTGRIADVALPDMTGERIGESNLPLLLTRTEARDIAERWIAEAAVARDTARFVLPPSQSDKGAGDVVRFGKDFYRLDRLELGESRLIEAVRVELAIYRPGTISREVHPWVPFVAPGPVYPLFLDLPLMMGSEVEHIPHAGVVAQPWPGPVALWASSGTDGFVLNTILDRSIALGMTENALGAADAGRWDAGMPLRVRFTSGQPASAADEAVLAGANLAAIGDGSAANWELFQFARAELVAPGLYELSRRLRGQAGTDGIMPNSWPAGSVVVLINSALRQIDLPPSARGVLRNYRFGTASQGGDALQVVAKMETFDGIGLRPYRVAHLRGERLASGDITLQWIRRTRIDGDNWQSPEVPLGEDGESYLLRIRQGETVLRQESIGSSIWQWSVAMQAMDGATAGAVTAEVAQISQRFGPGPAAMVVV